MSEAITEEMVNAADSVLSRRRPGIPDETIRLAIAAALDAQTPPPSSHLRVDVNAEIASVVQSVNEWDDRTSPDDYPEHLLITSEELADILRNFAATLEGSADGT